MWHLALTLLLLLAGSCNRLAAQGGGHPTSAERHFLRGVELQQRGDLQGAREAYLSALKLSPNRPDVNANLGLVYVRLAQYDKAIRCYATALQSLPGHEGLRLQLGLAYLQAQRFEPARRELSTVLKANPKHHQARQALGMILLKMNRLDEGIGELEKVYALQPGNLDVLYMLASAYIRGGRLEKASLLINGPLKQLNTPQAELIVGSYELAKRNYLTALAKLRKAQQLNPKLPGLHSELGYAHVLTGNQKLAIQMFEAELEVNPADFNAYAFLGWLYREQGRFDEATLSLKKALNLKPDDGGVLFQLAQLSQARGVVDETAKLLEQVVAVKPEFTPAHVLLAQIYFRQKRFEDAERERQIINRLNAEEQERQPSNPDLRYTGITIPLN